MTTRTRLSLPVVPASGEARAAALRELAAALVAELGAAAALLLAAAIDEEVAEIGPSAIEPWTPVEVLTARVLAELRRCPMDHRLASELAGKLAASLAEHRPDLGELAASLAEHRPDLGELAARGLAERDVKRVSGRIAVAYRSAKPTAVSEPGVVIEPHPAP